VRPGVLLVLVLGTGAVSACSSGGPADVQRTIDSDLPRTFPGLQVGPARCPADLDPQPNKPGACAITVEGGPVRVRVDRTDGGRFAVSSDQAVIPVGRLEASLQPAVSAKGGQSYAVDCGDEAVKVFDPPGTMTCVATSAHGAPVRLAVTVDKKGSFTFQPEQDP
jgi:hypothetical protein